MLEEREKIRLREEMTPMQKKLHDALKKKFYRYMEENEAKEVARHIQED
jgi:hypothetical protein